MSTKNLQYYLEHTDEMPTDPAEVERLAQEHMQAATERQTAEMTVDAIVGKPDDPAAKVEEQKADEKEPPKEEAKADSKEAPKEEAKPEAKAEGEPKPEGVLAKDGKNVIPYAVLESARDRAAKAEQLAAEQAKELETLKAQKPAAREEPKSELLTDEELAALQADSPTLAKVLAAQQAEIQKLTGTVTELKGRETHRATTEQAEVKSEIQTAIDAVPELAAWQADKDQSAFNIAVAHDMTLRRLPKYRDVSFEDRFKVAVRLTKLTLAEQEQEPEKEPEKAGLDVKAPKPEEVRAAAEAKLKALGAKGLPTSLSDIPGGAPPAVDERDRVEQMSIIELGQKFMGMSPEQREAYLAGL